MSELNQEGRTCTLRTIHMLKEAEDDLSKRKCTQNCPWRTILLTDTTTQNGLQIGHNLYQNPTQWHFFCRNRKTHPKILMKSQGILKRQNNLDQKKPPTKLDSQFFSSKRTTKLQFSAECGPSIRTDMKTNGRELRVKN